MLDDVIGSLISYGSELIMVEVNSHLINPDHMSIMKWSVFHGIGRPYSVSNGNTKIASTARNQK